VVLVVVDHPFVTAGGAAFGQRAHEAAPGTIR